MRGWKDLQTQMSGIRMRFHRVVFVHGRLRLLGIATCVAGATFVTGTGGQHLLAATPSPSSVGCPPSPSASPSITASVSPSAAPSGYPSSSPTRSAWDDFGRVVAEGLGDTDNGRQWVTGRTTGGYSVDGTQARFAAEQPNETLRAWLPDVALEDIDVRALVRSDKAADGSNLALSFTMRQASLEGPYYEAILRLRSDQLMDINLSRFGPDGDVSVGGSGILEGLQYCPGDWYWLHAQVTGTNPSALRAKAWALGTPEPADWYATSTDATASLQSPGGVGLRFYVGSLPANLPLTASWDQFEVLSRTVTNPSPGPMSPP